MAVSMMVPESSASAATPTRARKGAGTGSGVLQLKDGTSLYYKDWGDGPPVMFHHGWPLSADDWDAQMMFFLDQGFRVIAHDRRGHGRSTQTATGNDMDTYAADVAALVEHLDLKGVIHVGHSAGGGEVTRYVARAKKGRVAKAVLIAAVTPYMLKTDANPNGLPMSAFDGFRQAIAANRAQFYLDVPTGPFYGYNKDGKASEGVIRNWYRQGMTGSAKAHYDCVKAFSETDFTADLKSIAVPMLVMHGEGDQIVPPVMSKATVDLLKNGTLKTYPGFPHGMPTTHADVLNQDLFAFFRG